MNLHTKRWQAWAAWESAHIAAEPPNPKRALAIVDALYREARTLGIWDQPFTMESIQHKNKLAKAPHVRKPDRATGE